VLQLQGRLQQPSAGAGGTFFRAALPGRSAAGAGVGGTAEQKEALARYASQALRAIGDVENALAPPRPSLAERVQLPRQVLADQERALGFEQAAFRIGPAGPAAVQQQQVQVAVGAHGAAAVQSEQLIQRVQPAPRAGRQFCGADGVASAAAPK